MVLTPKKELNPATISPSLLSSIRSVILTAFADRTLKTTEILEREGVAR